MSTIEFFFVCQPGRIEIESLILAASFRQKIGQTHKLTAMVPTPATYFGHLDRRTLQAFDDLNVNVCRFVNPDVPIDHTNDVHVSTLLANKIFAYDAIKPTADTVVFLDSDTICLGQLSDTSWTSVPIVAIHTVWDAINAYGHDLDRVYRFFGVKRPLQQYEYRRHDQPKTYFCNAEADTNFISLNSSVLKSFITQWKKTFRAVRDNKLIESSYSNGVVSFLPAVLLCDYQYSLLKTRPASFNHYWAVRYLVEHTDSLKIATAAADKYPIIRELAKRHDEWAYFAS